MPEPRTWCKKLVEKVGYKRGEQVMSRHGLMKSMIAAMVLISLVMGTGMMAFAKTKLTIWDWHQPRVKLMEQWREPVLVSMATVVFYSMT
jgi:hypothetical protein